MANNELQRLREEARARHRAATRKISRLKSAHGAEVSGTKADPRRDLSNLKRYNSRQLKAYIRELNTFTDRRVQFVPDARGRPMVGELWNQYKQLEKRYKAKAEKEKSKVANIFLPFAGMTVAEREEMMTAPHPQVLSPAVNSPFRPTTRQPYNIRSEKALRELITEMRKRVSPGYFKKLTKDAREQYEQMTDLTKQPELDKRVRALSDAQFQALWQLTPFATAESLKYERAKDLLSGKEKPWQSDVIRQATENAYEFVAWAESLDLGS